MSGLFIKDVSKSFGGRVILDKVSLELYEGELLVVLGPSGCGKSTLLRLISGLENLDAGEIYIQDRRVDQLQPRDRNVALVFQNYSLYPHMSVAKNLAFPLKVAKVPKEEIKRRVQDIAELLGLEDRLGDKPGQLSGGQRQRVALGRAIIREPSIFLLDEPLSNLDADLRARMRLEIVKLQKQLKRTMVHVTHDQTEALTMADRIALLHEGKLQQLGTPEELYQQPANTFVASFIGQPKINLITSKIHNGKTQPFDFPIPDNHQNPATTEIIIGIRPETIEISKSGIFDGEIESSEYLGDQYIARIKYNDQLLTASQIIGELSSGQHVKFTINPTNLIWFDSLTGKRI